MTNGNEPITILHNSSEKDIIFNGLTKREYFAAMALQGILSNSSLEPTLISDEIASFKALKFADALINALNKTK